MQIALILLIVSLVVWELEVILYDHNRRLWLRIGLLNFELMRIAAFGIGGCSLVYLISKYGY